MSYLVHTPSSYCFRLTVPLDLRPYVGLREVRRSLKTGSISLAKERSRFIAGRIQKLFRCLREDRGNMKEGPNMDQLTSEYIQELIKSYVREALEEDEKERIMRTTPDPVEFHKTHLDILRMVRNRTQDHLIYNDASWVKDVVDKLLKDNGLEVDEDSFEYKALSREMLKACLFINGVQIKREQGDYSDTPVNLIEQSAPPVIKQVELEVKTDSPLLSELIQSYMNENIRAGNWSDSTISEYRSCGKLLIRLLEDTKVNTIDYEKGRLYKEALSAIPPRFIGMEKYKDYKLEQIVKLEVERPLSVGTINKNLDFTSGLFNFAVRNKYMTENPVDGLRVKQRKRPDENREAFSEKDLVQIFHSEEFLGDKLRLVHAFWLPVLGLFTGARLGELSQLTTDSLKQDNDIWYLDIQGELKSLHSVRQVPLHPFLIEDLKFHKFVQQSKPGKLFTGLNTIDGKHGHNFTNWFGRFKKRIGMVTAPGEPKKSFHSFRHTFITKMKYSGVDVYRIKQTVGHSANDITMGLYGKRYPVDDLYENVILKLDFDIDLEHLKSSKYTG